MLEILLEPKFCLAFSLKKDVIIEGLSKPFLMKKDAISRTEMNSSQRKHKPVLYNQILGTAGPDQMSECPHHSSLSNALLRSLRKPLVYGKQFWMRAKAQKPYFILTAANRLIPPPNSLETEQPPLSAAFVWEQDDAVPRPGRIAFWYLLSITTPCFRYYPENCETNLKINKFIQILTNKLFNMLFKPYSLYSQVY